MITKEKANKLFEKIENDFTDGQGSLNYERMSYKLRELLFVAVQNDSNYFENVINDYLTK